MRFDLHQAKCGLKSIPVSQILIVQPYVADYRARFYEKLFDLVRDTDLTLNVATDRRMHEQAHLTGSAIRIRQQIDLSSTHISIGGKEFKLRNLGPILSDLQITHLILEQAFTNLELWVHIFSRTREVGLWGHGYRPTALQSGFSSALNRAALTRAKWFFAYTERGAEHARKLGLPPDRISILNNANDSLALRRHIAAISTSERQATRLRYHLTRGKTAVFVGTLTREKGIDLLVQAAKDLTRADPAFRIVIVGSGPEKLKVLEAIDRGVPIIRFPRLTESDLARLLAVSDVLIVPGRIGLVAVDALASGLPVVSVKDGRHAPEVDYLTEGENLFLVESTPESLTAGVQQALSCSHNWRNQAQSFLPTAENMAENFLDGLLKWTTKTHIEDS